MLDTAACSRVGLRFQKLLCGAGAYVLFMEKELFAQTNVK